MRITQAHTCPAAPRRPGSKCIHLTHRGNLPKCAVDQRASAVVACPVVADSSARRTSVEQPDAFTEASRIAAPRGECALDTLETLRSLLPQHALEDVLRKCPQLLNADIGTWEAFFSAYGAADTYLPRLIQRAPRFFLTACLFSAGNVLLTFRALGIDPEDALEMVVLDTPGVLNVPSEQVAERIGLMRAQGLSNAEIADAIMRNPMEVLC